MNSKLFIRHIKNNILKYTVSFSAVVHFLGIFLFPSWGTIPDLIAEKVIKIKTVVKKPEKPILKKLTEPQKKIERETLKPAKQSDPAILKVREKTQRVKSVQAVRPSPVVKRNPVPLNFSEQNIQPMKPIQKNSIIPESNASLKKMAELKIPLAHPAGPRQVQSQTRVIASSEGLKPRQQTESFFNTREVKAHRPATHAPSTLEVSSLIPTTQIKGKTKVALIDTPNTQRITYSDGQGELKRPTFTLAKIISATTQDDNLSNKSPASNVEVTAGKRELTTNPLIGAKQSQTLNQGTSIAPASTERFASKTVPGPSMGVQMRSPQGFNSKLSTAGNRTLPVTEKYSPAPSGATSLVKMVSIPSGFFEEIIGGNGETKGNQHTKKNNSAGGENEISAEQMRKIKKEFSAMVRTKIAQTKYYPRVARRRGFEGEPVVAFTLGNDGNLMDISINNPSPHKLLDKAALDAVKSASPYPPIPELLKMKSIRFKLPISFIQEDP